MTPEEGISHLIALAQAVPAIAEGIRRVIIGHPSAQRLADVLKEQGESALLAEELRREGGG